MCLRSPANTPTVVSRSAKPGANVSTPWYPDADRARRVAPLERLCVVGAAVADGVERVERDGPLRALERVAALGRRDRGRVELRDARAHLAVERVGRVLHLREERPHLAEEASIDGRRDRLLVLFDVGEVGMDRRDERGRARDRDRHVRAGPRRRAVVVLGGRPRPRRTARCAAAGARRRRARQARSAFRRTRRRCGRTGLPRTPTLAGRRSSARTARTGSASWRARHRA